MREFIDRIRVAVGFRAILFGLRIAGVDCVEIRLADEDDATYEEDEE